MRVMCMLKLRELLSCEDVNYLAQPYRLQEKLWQNVKVASLSAISGTGGEGKDSPEQHNESARFCRCPQDF